MRRATMIKSLLTHRRLPLAAALPAVLLTLPLLWSGLIIDELFIRLVARQPEPFPLELPASHHLFRLVSVSRSSNVLRGS